MSFDPETLSLVAAGAIGIVGLYFFSSGTSADGDDPNANKKNSGAGNILPPDFLGLGSGVSAETAKEHGYDVDPDKDPAASGLCTDNSGVYDPNKNIGEKVFDATPIGWPVWLGQSFGKALACAQKGTKVITDDTAAADAAYKAGNFSLAYDLIRSVVSTQSALFGVDETYTQRMFDRRGPDADKSLPQNLLSRLRVYTAAFYTFVICKAQLNDRRQAYKMACDMYNDDAVPADKVVDMLNKISAMTTTMQAGAVPFYTTFFDPDSDISTNTTTMYANITTGFRSIVHYDASQNTTVPMPDPDSATDNTDAASVNKVVFGGIIAPTRPVSTQPTDEQMIRALVLASVADFPALSKSYRDSMSMLKFNTLYAKMLPLRDAYGRYMNGVQVYKTWQASAAEASDDVRAAVADGAAAYKQLPPYIVTDTVGIASALHVIDEDTRYRHPKFDTSLPGGQKVVGAAGRYYSGADCNYGGCQ